MSNCTLCPRGCGADRSKQGGFCHAGDKVKIAWWGLHSGEEPPISGDRGSGTIFFSHCNLRCVYCQNWQISQEALGQAYEDREVVKMMLALQQEGAANINLVSPTVWASHLIKIIPRARNQGLKIPIVYNTNAYDSVETLRSLAGLIQIYLPDYKYSQEELAVKYSAAPNYPQIARLAILEMHRQVGDPVVNSRGIAEKGVIVRHLILPDAIPNSLGCLDFLREVSPTVFVSLMSQYSPSYKTQNFPEINRPINKKEYTTVKNYLEKLELDGWVQEFSEPVGVYQPDFRKKRPFGN
ncbi:MAG: 4Fe-4S cluster-binding domain-containing protein [bacterium]|nr:4Fe-4S cluster-binding domain-containing protein [bacterium]